MLSWQDFVADGVLELSQDLVSVREFQKSCFGPGYCSVVLQKKKLWNLLARLHHRIHLLRVKLSAWEHLYFFYFFLFFLLHLALAQRKVQIVLSLFLNLHLEKSMLVFLIFFTKVAHVEAFALRAHVSVTHDRADLAKRALDTFMDLVGHLSLRLHHHRALFHKRLSNCFFNFSAHLWFKNWGYHLLALFNESIGHFTTSVTNSAFFVFFVMLSGS